MGHGAESQRTDDRGQGENFEFRIFAERSQDPDEGDLRTDDIRQQAATRRDLCQKNKGEHSGPPYAFIIRRKI